MRTGPQACCGQTGAPPEGGPPRPRTPPLFENLDQSQLIVLATLAVSLLLFVTDALRYDLIAALIVLVLALSGTLTPEQAFAGFADPAVVLIASMYIFSRAVNRWGLAELIAQTLLGGGRRKTSEGFLAFRVTAVSGLLSSVLSNTGVVATLIPVLSSLSRKLKIPVSRLLIPLSYGSLFGGLLTLIGTSTNVAVNGQLREMGATPLGLFEFSGLGLVLLLAGSLYFLGPGRLLLPNKRQGETLTEHYQVPKFITEVLVEPSSTLMNRTVAEAPQFHGQGVGVLGIVRPGADTILAPGPYNRIRSGDVLIVQGEPEKLVGLRKELGLRERKSVEVDGTRLDSGDVQLVEAVLPAGSPLNDRTLAETDFRARTGINVLAVSQHARVQPTKLGHVRMHVGDSLLLQGHERDIERMRASRELLILDELDLAPFGRGAMLTILILGAVLAAAAFGLADLAVAALAGATALVLTGVVRPDDASRAVDWSVLLLVGGMLALGTAFESHGLSSIVSESLLQFGSATSSPHFLIGLFLVSTIVLTQLTTNVTAGVIMVQVAVESARTLAIDDRAFIMAVVSGASMAFMSPVAHQANTMVVGPGDYRFRDFLRVGAPLTLIVTALEIVILPLMWPITKL